MERRILNPWKWQEPFGFVQGNEIEGARRVIVCAGQTSTDADGKPIHVGDMKAQLSQALDNLETVLGEAGLDLSNVMRLNYYTTDVDSFLASSGELKDRLKGSGCRPASTLLGVTRLAYPEFLVEIEATAMA